MDEQRSARVDEYIAEIFTLVSYPTTEFSNSTDYDDCPLKSDKGGSGVTFMKS